MIAQYIMTGVLWFIGLLVLAFTATLVLGFMLTVWDELRDEIEEYRRQKQERLEAPQRRAEFRAQRIAALERQLGISDSNKRRNG